MSTELYAFSVTVSAGIAKASPAATALAMPQRRVDKIEVRVPPGPRGELGFQLGSGGLQMIPLNAGAFIVDDDRTFTWELTDQLTSGAWQLIAYNTGDLPHTLQVRFECSVVAGDSAASPAPIPESVLNAPAGQVVATPAAPAGPPTTTHLQPPEAIPPPPLGWPGTGG